MVGVAGLIVAPLPLSPAGHSLLAALGGHSMNRKVAIAVAAMILGAGPGLAKDPEAPTAAEGAASQHASGIGAYRSGDNVTALQFYRPLAERGDAFAQFILGSMCESGEGVPQDYVQAHMWFNLAAAAGDAAAPHNRDLVAAMMTPAQIAEAQRLASEWKPTK